LPLTVAAYVMRPIEARDAQFIIDLHAAQHVRELLVGPTLELLQRGIAASAADQWIVLDGDERVGMIIYARLEPWLFEIRRMIALHEGRGIGSFALAFALDDIFEMHKAHRAYLEVHAKNMRARALYQRFGFRYEGAYRNGAVNPLTGAYEDLCIYGLLEDSFRSKKTTRRQSQR
jgi:RimJ/RimL family protein N-acetyltransferase